MPAGSEGFTLIELLVVITILGILAAIALPRIFDAIEVAKQTKAIADMRNLDKQIQIYYTLNSEWPSEWGNVNAGPMPRDPWGNFYVYTRHENLGLLSLVFFRTDGPIVNINTDYDLYSKGPDGESIANILLGVSLDDIVRANDGSFFGLAKEY